MVGVNKYFLLKLNPFLPKTFILPMSKLKNSLYLISPAGDNEPRDLLGEARKEPGLSFATPPVSHHIAPHLPDNMTKAQLTGCSRLGDDEMDLKQQQILCRCHFNFKIL